MWIVSFDQRCLIPLSISRLICVFLDQIADCSATCSLLVINRTSSAFHHSCIGISIRFGGSISSYLVCTFEKIAIIAISLQRDGCRAALETTISFPCCCSFRFMFFLILFFASCSCLIQFQGSGAAVLKMRRIAAQRQWTSSLSRFVLALPSHVFRMN